MLRNFADGVVDEVRRIGTCIAPIKGLLQAGRVRAALLPPIQGGKMTHLEMHWKLREGADGRKRLCMYWQPARQVDSSSRFATENKSLSRNER